MSNLYAEEELNKCSKQELITINLALQTQVEKLNENLESLIEQLRIANAQRFGRKTERLSEIAGQLSFFNEPEAYADDDAPEPDPESAAFGEVIENKTYKSRKDGENDRADRRVRRDHLRDVAEKIDGKQHEKARISRHELIVRKRRNEYPHGDQSRAEKIKAEKGREREDEIDVSVETHRKGNEGADKCRDGKGGKKRKILRADYLRRSEGKGV